MSPSQQKETIRITVERAIGALSSFLVDGLYNDLEPVRLARTACILLSAGCSSSGSFPWHEIAERIVKKQREDGGWSDVEETIWSIGLLNKFPFRYTSNINNGIGWLKSVRLPCGVWGRNNRDQPRIITTALASFFVQSIIDNSALRWMSSQWETDMKSTTKLTYKAGFFLLTTVYENASSNESLKKRTVTFLENSQNDDGGFGPWKGHPVGSDPWSTGIVLWGLSKVGDQAPKPTIERTVKWLRSKQLPNGFWPYHYLDDGTAMALIGITSVLPVLRG